MSYSRYYPGFYLKGLIKTPTSPIRTAGGIQAETDPSISKNKSRSYFFNNLRDNGN
jgi:hypothetical protein